jgi:hypothetical protein
VRRGAGKEGEKRGLTRGAGWSAAGRASGRKQAAWAEGGGHACGSLAEGACGLGRARRQAVGRAVRSWAKCVTRDWAERGSGVGRGKAWADLGC